MRARTNGRSRGSRDRGSGEVLWSYVIDHRPSRSVDIVKAAVSLTDLGFYY